jgi:serine/threonine protein kinase
MHTCAQCALCPDIVQAGLRPARTCAQLAHVCVCNPVYGAALLCNSHMSQARVKTVRDHSCMLGIAKDAHSIQFYNERDTYEREVAVFDIEQLQDALLPVVQASDNTNQECTGPFEFVFPPFAITERGEPLTEWVSRSAPDLPTTIFVLLHVAERLQQLHEAGWAHRDLKCDATSPRMAVTMLMCCRSPGVMHRSH